MTSRWVFPRPPSLPDNPVAAARKGWWDSGIFAAVQFEPQNWDEAIAADPIVVHALRHPTSRHRVVQVAPLGEYAFRADSNAIEEITLAEKIDARGLQSGTLLVDFQRAPAWTGADAAIQIVVINTAAASEEPPALTRPGDVASIVIASATPAPLLCAAELSTPIAARLRVGLRWLQGRTPSTAEERFALAVDLVGRV